MYCTGGIRCERASALVKAKTKASEVYQLQGGIHNYIDEFGNSGFWKGKNFVFDNRLAIGSAESLCARGKESAESSTTGDSICCCFYCGVDCDDYRKCGTPNCHVYVVVCQTCLKKGENKEAQLQASYFICCDACRSCGDLTRGRVPKSGPRAVECYCNASRLSYMANSPNIHKR